MILFNQLFLQQFKKLLLIVFNKSFFTKKLELKIIFSEEFSLLFTKFEIDNNYINIIKIPFKNIKK